MTPGPGRHERPFAHGPPKPKSEVLIDAASGAAHPFASPAWPPGLQYPKAHDEPLRFRTEVMAPGEDFDQAGFELPPAPPEAPAQPELFADDCSQSDLSACTAQADAAESI